VVRLSREGISLLSPLDVRQNVETHLVKVPVGREGLLAR